MRAGQVSRLVTRSGGLTMGMFQGHRSPTLPLALGPAIHPAPVAMTTTNQMKMMMASLSLSRCKSRPRRSPRQMECCIRSGTWLTTTQLCRPATVIIFRGWLDWARLSLSRPRRRSCGLYLAWSVWIAVLVALGVDRWLAACSIRQHYQQHTSASATI